MSSTGAPSGTSRVGPTGSQPQQRQAGPTGSQAQQQQQQMHIEQAAKDARLQEHWLKWSGIANQDRTYPVVIDQSQSSPPVLTELKRIVGPSVKTTPVHRVLGLDEDAPADKDLGSVLVGLISASTYSTLSEKLSLKSITVKLNSGERTAFIPTAVKPASAAKKAED